jgi:hypothetical protein
MKSSARDTRHQVIVVTDDAQRLLARAAIPPYLLTRIVTPAQFLDLVALDVVAAAVVDATALTPTLDSALTAYHQSGAPIPLIEVVPVSLHRPFERAAWATALVATNRAHVDLLPVVRQGAINAALAAAATALHARVGSADRTDVFLCSIPSRVPPVRSVSDAAELAQCAPDTLNRHWTSFQRAMCEPRAEPMPLKAHCDWPILLRAIGQKRPETNWEQIAAWLNVSAKRLRALAHAYCAAPLNVLVNDEPLYAPQAYAHELRERFGITMPLTGEFPIGRDPAAERA